MIRRFLLLAIAFGFFTLPVHAIPKTQENPFGMSDQDQLKIMKRICQMNRDGYTSAEIRSHATYLVKINTEQATLPKEQSTGPYADLASSMLEDSNESSNELVAYALAIKAIQSHNCKF